MQQSARVQGSRVNCRFFWILLEIFLDVFSCTGSDWKLDKLEKLEQILIKRKRGKEEERKLESSLQVEISLNPHRSITEA